jgi:copper chaperone CopZ
MTDAYIHVKGMSCPGCARAVTFTMSHFTGGEAVDADPGAGRVRVS